MIGAPVFAQAAGGVASAAAVPAAATTAAAIATAAALAAFAGTVVAVGIAYGKLRQTLADIAADLAAIETRVRALETNKVEVSLHDACQSALLRAIKDVTVRLDRLIEMMIRERRED